MPSTGVISISLYDSAVLTKCGKRALRWPHAPASWFACACAIPSHDCFQSTDDGTGDVTSLLGLCYRKRHLANNRLALTDRLAFSLAGFEDANCHVVRSPVKRNVWQELRATSGSCGQLLNNSQKEVGALSLPGANKRDVWITCVSLEADPLPRPAP